MKDVHVGRSDWLPAGASSPKLLWVFALLPCKLPQPACWQRNRPRTSGTVRCPQPQFLKGVGNSFGFFLARFGNFLLIHVPLPFPSVFRKHLLLELLISNGFCCILLLQALVLRGFSRALAFQPFTCTTLAACMYASVNRRACCLARIMSAPPPATRHRVLIHEIHVAPVSLVSSQQTWHSSAC